MSEQAQLRQGLPQGSESVRTQIRKRWGEAEANRYDPERNCFTLETWNALGYLVNKGEKALVSYPTRTEQSETQAQDGRSEPLEQKPVYLFFDRQVHKKATV